MSLKGIFLLGTTVYFSGCSQKAAERPNILVLVSDDQGNADFSAYGGASDVQTPNLDRIANEGIRFTNAYSASPICSPARAALITGQYPQRWGTYYYGGESIPKENPTLAEMLRDNGYRCVKIGKTHFSKILDNNDKIKDPTKDRDFPLNHGFESFFGFTAHRHDYFRLTKADRERVRPADALMSQHGPLWRNKERVDCDGYTTDLFGQEAICQILDEDKRPFFIQVSFNAVHHPIFQAPEKYLKKFGIAPFLQWNPEGEPFAEWHKRWCWKGKEDPNGRKRYLASLACLDDNVGAILDALEKSGKKDNTIVVFLSDNGGSQNTYANNGALLGHKYILAEGGIRTPFVMSWPGKWEKGQVCDAICSHMDLYPTLASILGIPKNEMLDGQDLYEELKTAKSSSHNRELVWDTGNEYAVRKGDWKLWVVKKDNHFRTIHIDAGEYLFNLKEDEGEREDLKEKYPEKVEELKNIYQTWKQEVDSER